MPRRKKPLHPRYLPGDPKPENWLAQMIRVNHAGEYGAKRIYLGQLSVLKKTPAAPTLKHMLEQEQEHLAFFEEQIRTRRIRPTALLPFWHAAGWVLGAASARIGAEAAMAVTVAVEETIDAHYQQQSTALEYNPQEQPLRDKIEKFRQDELQHRDTALEQDAEQAPAYMLLSKVIKTGCKTAIWLSKRL